ncbi:putative quinol monooxygenase [Flagellimonas myxillae]|uniref:putative quinol monooxygenase n=1 Tax=Flagellimonas myxillae TaxID=2942214 RepID=UPI00201F5CF5|nr:antibiotic biosynthesis monooxygenase family protein [Muricauda myxillae]MCL6266701.1 antibiotic biosynthesis monooxygenase [Muricauda myxillae]
MIHVFVPYQVKPEAVDTVKEIVGRFISEIRKNEPGTLFYKSYQQVDDPTCFTHVMAFENEQAESLHKKSTYCREFTHVLYPLCEKMPVPISQNEIQ